ncbi:monocarboxylate transporter 6-like, partial [Ylistrum balloti]|uniref:monocarboxylate transporter 6-like n=1 Tax=Ylistrum balloti TaxID=509963 RepID=UPI0029059B64
MGMCLVHSSAVIIVNQYFSKRRGLANALAGWAVWAFIVPAAINFLFEYYGFLGAFLIQSGVVLHIIVCGSLFRPLLIDINSKRKSQQTANPKHSIESGQVDKECCYITDINDTVSGGFYFGGLCTTGGALIFATANIVHWNKTKSRPKFVSDNSKISEGDTFPNRGDTSCRLESFRPMN